MGSAAGELDHSPSFQMNLFGSEVFKWPETARKEHRHDVNVQLINKSRFEALLGGTRATDNGNLSGPAAALDCLMPLSIPSVTNVKVNLPVSLGCFFGASWVRATSSPIKFSGYVVCLWKNMIVWYRDATGLAIHQPIGAKRHSFADECF